jgi:branched-chain amino acid transport system substrate-binding protein
MLPRKPWLTLFLTSGLMTAGAASILAADASFTLKYGVLAGLTGDPAPSGQAWNASAKLGIDYIAATLDRMKPAGLKVELTDSQDSQGTPQQGVEAAQKLVQIDGSTSSSATSIVPSRVPPRHQSLSPMASSYSPAARTHH